MGPIVIVAVVVLAVVCSVVVRLLLFAVRDVIIVATEALPFL